MVGKRERNIRRYGGEGSRGVPPGGESPDRVKEQRFENSGHRKDG